MSWLYDLCLYTVFGVLIHYQSGNLFAGIKSGKLGFLASLLQQLTSKISVKADPFVFAQTFLTTALAWGYRYLVTVKRTWGWDNQLVSLLSSSKRWKVMVLVSSAFLRLVSRFVCRTNWAKLTLRGQQNTCQNSVQNSAVPARSKGE